MAKARYERGFTLVEVLVVVVIVAIMFAMLGVRFSPSDAQILREEGTRLALRLEQAQEEAVMRGTPIRWEIDEKGYRFFLPARKGKWQLLYDDPYLKERFWRDGVFVYMVEIDGEYGEDDGVRFDALGLGQPFTIVLGKGSAQLQVIGDGKRVKAHLAYE